MAGWLMVGTIGIAPGWAGAEQLCATQTAWPLPDGRILGHLPYPQALATDLVSAPPGFAIGLPCLIHRDAAVDLTRLLSAAAIAPGVGRTLRAISCFRTIVHQRGVFCGQIGPGRRFSSAALRARFVGPPGFSEHATGYAIDFAIRPSPGCADVNQCIASTGGGRWLLANAPQFGFELSFPAGNAQGVTWEPWHWRWVGTASTAPGAARARALFATARVGFPASPAIIEGDSRWLRVLRQPPAASPLQLPPPSVFQPPSFRR